MSHSGDLRVVVATCSRDSAELCADALVNLGALAVEERELDTAIALRSTLDNPLNEVAAALLAFDPNVVVVEEFVDRAVLDTWRHFAEVTSVSENLVIVPTWLAGEATYSGNIVLIDPEESFGIGDHPTTRQCADWLHRQTLRGSRVLDAGCGTGVLAVIAAMNGASVVGVDIADNALKATARNAALNRVTLERVCHWDGMDQADEFDLIVANILAPALIELAPRLIQMLAPSGRIALAGLRSDQTDRILAAYRALKLVSRGNLKGWEFLVLQRA